MFNNLDTSVLDDSTGLKLLNYLTRGDDKERLPRTRNRLFRLQATESSVDDFSIRQVKGKENTNAQQTPAAAPASPRRSTIPAQPQERSSLFKPNCASTPVVPTTVHTPYRPSKKSIGIQKSQTPSLPLSQQPEIPETPEKVPEKQAEPPQKKQQNDPEPPPLPPKPPMTVIHQQVVDRIYPNLEHVILQQETFPAPPSPFRSSAVAPPPPPPKTPVAQVIPSSQPPQIEQQVAVAEAPKTPRTVTNHAAPLMPHTADRASHTPRMSLRVVSPERLMEIIHPNRPTDTEERIIRNPQMSHLDEQRILQSPPRDIQYPETPRGRHLGVRSPHRISEDPLDEPEDEFVAPAAMEPKTPAPHAANQGQLDDSSFYDVPTPVMRNFKFVVPDCMRADATAKCATRYSRVTATTPAPTPKNVPTTKKKDGKGDKKLHRASELTISKESRRSSITVAASANKRKLHSIVRELTPIGSPVLRSQVEESTLAVELPNEESVEASTHVLSRSRKTTTKSSSDDSVFKRPVVAPSQVKKTKSTAGPKSKKKILIEEGEATASSCGSDSDAAAGSSQSGSGQEKRKRVTSAGPKSKKKEIEREMEMQRNSSLRAMDGDVDTEPELVETVPTKRRSTATKAGTVPAASEDDSVFKKPTLPAPKTRRKRETSQARETQVSGFESYNENNSTRRSGRTARPVAAVLPYSMLDKYKEAPVRTINYNPNFQDFCKSVLATTNSKRTKTVAKKSTSSATKSKTATESMKEKTTAVGTKKQKTTSEESKKKKSEISVDKEAKLAKTSKTKTSKMSNDEIFDAMKKNRESEMPVIAEVEEDENVDWQYEAPVEREEQMEELPRKRSASANSKGTTEKRKTKRGKARSTSTTPSTAVGGNSVQTTYSDNFSCNMPPTCSTGVDSFATSTMQQSQQSMVMVSKTMHMESLDMTDGLVRRQDFEGGFMMTWPDYSQGNIVLNSKKKRARVKRNPLVLNVASGTVIVNLESEHGAVRLTQDDQISIPVNMWYSIEKVSEVDPVLMFTWK